MITKVLVANRGEIACRIIDSVQAAGYDAVAVHSDADAKALFVGLADETVSLGGNTSAESYLDINKIIAAAKASGADAIHPGYGFLSENAEFSALCQENGIIFIGPSATAIEVMGNKAEAKHLMLSSGVPCIPGYQGETQDAVTLASEANAIGFPIMVKAAAGGGGRGIRLVESAEALQSAVESARIEAQNAFGSVELILEKAVVNSRHIEVQIAADQHGNVIHLFERDCSAQRRHQKVIEEAPSPFMTETLRGEMGLAAVNAARAVNYEGVGTVEFLVDADRNFYFLEMNTRLQVEHPVTEMITGVDLVEWQLQIANGNPLPLQQDDMTIDGHAIEVRIYAEDPGNGFMPQTGKVLAFEPSVDEGIRIDHGIYSGAVVSPFYDSMLAKLIAWGRDREEARRRLIRALKQTKLLGLMTNKTFLIRLLSEEQFVNGEATTSFISDDVLKRANPEVAKADLALATVLLNQNSSDLNGWSNSAPLLRTETLLVGEDVHPVKILQTDSGFDVFIADDLIQINGVKCYEDELVYTLDGVTRVASFSIVADEISLDLGDRVLNFTRTTYRPAVAEGEAGSGLIKASTEGLVVDVLVKPGDVVNNGDTLVVIEAMKMEHRHLADGAGEVTSVNVKNGQQVKNRQLLVELALTEVEDESA
ncbi:MAG: acetyl-CoA carboxylase biotin carboxylase subunit [Deltaproteobacteria bacterium]|nr:acetyl-CoA carboxylase biotin carboxylase subunit [Deltaproteobacteria bacterium]MBT4638844.1 acetyl-CoA carboxylase biotin carboxylase subunit [Deltaproteobacteria bacterium]MBT6614034.1 acetyl-CoA carboxylase biotin carboxylase subunit [Deltaproteobacteria bacterium]